MSGSVSSAYAEDTDFGFYSEALLEYQMDLLGCYSYQDLVTNNYAKDPGTGEEWWVVALTHLRTDINYEAYRESLGEYLKNTEISSPTQRQKDALTYLAVGGDKETVANVADETIGELGMMSYVYGLHLLNNDAPSKLHTKESIVDQILSMQMKAGGWAIMGEYADVDTTAMTIQALAPYYHTNAEVKSAVDKALDLIGSKQREDGGYISFGAENPEGSAQLIMALASIGIDAKEDERFIKNGHTLMDAIEGFKLPDGTFSHTTGGDSNKVTTHQVMYCSASYKLLKEGNGRTFYIFGDLKEAPTDDSKDMHPENAKKMNTKTIMYIGVGVIGIVSIIYNVLMGKKNYKSYLSIFLACALAAGAIYLINIKSVDDYYKDDTEYTGEYMTTTISIRCDTVAGKKDFIPKDGIILDTVEVKVPVNCSAIDQIVAAAKQNKIQLDIITANGYINGINYIYERDFGDLSGWMYRVNGEYASVGASEMKLKEGDLVEWLYTTNLGEDIGNIYNGGE